MKTMLDHMMDTWRNAGMDADLMLESTKTQWKAAGMNPDLMLEQLKSQPAPDVDYTQYAQQAQEAQQAMMDAFYGEGDDDEDYELDDPLTDWDEDTIPLSSESDVVDINDLRAILCGANLSMVNQMNLNSLSTLGSHFSKDDILQMLDQDWGINSRVELLETIQWLNDGGHRGHWKKIWACLQQIPSEEWSISSQIVANTLAADGADPETVAEYTENLVDGISNIKALGLLDNFNSWNCITWDYARAINLCRWGFDVGYLKKEEALSKIKGYATEIFSTYHSWEEVSMGYILGFVMWNADSYALNEMLHQHYVLLNNSRSPWQLLDY